MERLKSCTLCPRMCRIDRTSGGTGFCGADNRVKIGGSRLHFWEEPCVSGENGSGTVFFSHCTLKCVYCQNFGISTKNQGRHITEDELAKIFLSLQKEGANNINLVTPTHYVPQIITALRLARENGLTLPILYNTSGYENIETIKSLDGYVDIFMPDLKYFDKQTAIRYSNAKDYFEIAKKAIAQMFSQVGKCEFDASGIIKKGVIVRHLMLPQLTDDTKKILEYLHEEYGDDIFISIMSQYTPPKVLPDGFPELKNPLDMKCYDEVIDYAIDIGIENAFIQEEGAASESFIPEFYGDE